MKELGITKGEWHDIPNYEGYYQININGDVKSLNRTITNSNGHPYTVTEKILTPTIGSPGYKRVLLTKNGVKKWRTVHQLLAYTFLNHNPNTSLVVDHIDGNKLNNDLSNLQILTQRENISKGFMNKETTSKYTGVTKSNNGKKWRCSVSVEGKTMTLGTFERETDAHNCYRKFYEIAERNSELLERYNEAIEVLEEIKKVIKHHPHHIVDENRNKWKVVEVSDIEAELEQTISKSK